MSDNGTSRDYLSHRLLRILEERLNARGMELARKAHDNTNRIRPGSP